MKKLFILSLALLLVAGFAAAQQQGLTFGGQVYSGIGLMLSDHENFGDPVLGEYSMRENYAAGRADLWMYYVNPEDNAGFRILLRGQGNATTATANASSTRVVVYEAWFRALDGMLEFRGGQLDQNGFFEPLGGANQHLRIGENPGAYVQARPMDGLAIRLGTFFDVPSNNSLFSGMEAHLRRYGLGVRYDVPDLLNVIAIASLYNTEVVDTSLGFQITALREMGFNMLNIDAAFLNVGESKKDIIAYQNNINIKEKMTIQVGQRVEYNTTSSSEGIGGGIRFTQAFRDNPSPIRDYMDLTFTGFVQYRIDNWVPRLQFGYNRGSGIRNNFHPGPVGSTSNADGIYVTDDFRANWDGVNKFQFQKDAGNFIVSPSVQYRFGGRTNQIIELGYTLQKDLSKGDPDRSMNHIVALDYRVQF